VTQDPNLPALLQADRLLTIGLVDQAEALYQDVLRRDPRSERAVIGIANSLLSRGEDRRAYHTLLQALELNPNDTTALRMEARLSEILAARGEVVKRPQSVLGPNEKRRTLFQRLTGES